MEGSFSHANFLVRGTANLEALTPQVQAVSQSQAYVARVSAVVKAMSRSEFDIARGDTWAAIVADPKKLQRVQLGLQQVAPCQSLMAS